MVAKNLSPTQPDKDTIRNILTLRYAPNLESILPRLGWNDFIPKNEEPSLDFIQQLIESQISKIIPVSTGKITVALSGGVDSTLILALFKKIKPDFEITALSVKFSNSTDETKMASEIANHFDIKHQIIHLDNFLKELPMAISITKLPFWDLHWHHIAKEAKKHSSFLISGDGGDEIFGGYSFRYSKFLSLTDNNSDTMGKIDAYLQCHERDRVPDQEDIFGKKFPFSWENIKKNFIPFFDNSLDRINQVFLADYNGKLLYNFSIVNNFLNNHFGIKSLTPLLSSDLISYGTHLHPKYKYNPKTNVGKNSLRKILSRLNVEHLTANEKLGFSVNTSNLWQEYGYKICKEYLTNSRIVEDGLINQDWIDEYIDQENLDVRYINKFLGLLAFEVWYRLFTTAEIKPTVQLV